ncbi:CPBP family intramembrane metalloprotease [Flaviramulus sp. BrNp1-15]|uniref:CPBP family intramembrane glutamic endopeptidase n=1 Tax=Flaviramulus sp. BrNp1-15 TaxID=2916754 RepID=UPI001EE7CFC3|nr:type II CAAX endopeptidase family protein [Flaviramulus sp. BrNp1-15]ULC57925.1 CPBP family intramembrane metalloprotease [Flaviramulus sp. BrNp1-15]
MLKEKPLYEVTIIVAIISTILFRLFINVSGKLLSSLGIQELILNYDLKYLIFSIIELIGVLLFLYYYNNKQIIISKTIPVVYILIAIMLAIFYVLFQEWLNWFYDLVFKTNYQEQISYDFKIPVFSKLLLAQSILIPIAEELFFREYIQKGLQKNYRGFIAVGLSSILFTVAHLSDVHNMYLVFFGGLISAILYLKSKSIIPSIVFHVMWNITIQFT